MKRWKPSAPLAQIPLCTHKHRNSSKITKKAGTFSHPRDPKSFPNAMLRRNVFRKRRGVAFASWIGSPEPCEEEVSVVDCVCVPFFSLHICVYLHLCVCVCVLKAAEVLRRAERA